MSHQQQTPNVDEFADEQQAHGARCTISQTTDGLQVDVMGRPGDDIKDVVSAAHQEFQHFGDEWTALDYTEFVSFDR